MKGLDASWLYLLRDTSEQTNSIQNVNHKLYRTQLDVYSYLLGKKEVLRLSRTHRNVQYLKLHIAIFFIFIFSRQVCYLIVAVSFLFISSFVWYLQSSISDILSLYIHIKSKTSLYDRNRSKQNYLLTEYFSCNQFLIVPIVSCPTMS